MVRGNGVDHDGRLAVPLDEVGPDRGVAAAGLARDGLAQVVKQARALRHIGIEAELARQERGEEGRLDRMVQNVLVVGKPVAQSAEQLDDLGMEAVDVELVDGVLPGLRRHELDFVLGPLDRLFDAGGVDAAVLNECLEGDPCDLAAHGIEGRQEDELRRLVDEQGDAGRGLERLDVAPLATDDPALHFLAGKVDKRGGEIAVRLARDPLHRGNQDPSRLVVQVLLGLFDGLAAQHPQLVLGLKQHFLPELALDLLRVHLGNAFEALSNALRQGPDRIARLADGGIFPVDPLLALLELVVEQGERLLMGADFSQPHVRLDLPAVEFPVQFSALFLDLALGLLLQLLGGDGGLAAGDLDQLGRLLVRDPAGLPGGHPHDEETGRHPREQRHRQRPVKRVALGYQKREINSSNRYQDKGRHRVVPNAPKLKPLQALALPASAGQGPHAP